MQENNAGNLNDKGQDAAQSNQPAGQEALEGNTGVGGRSVDQGGDSDGNTGVMSNDEFEDEQEPGSASTSTEDFSGGKGG